VKKNFLVATLTASLVAGLALTPVHARQGRGDEERGQDRDWCEVRKRPRFEEPVRRWDRGRPPWASDWRRHDTRAWYRPSQVVVVQPRPQRVVVVERGAPVAVRYPLPPLLPGTGREFVGTLLGGATGGILGAQLGHGSGRAAAIAGGAVLGALVGGGIGRSMDLLDQAYVAGALEYSSTREPVGWRNPDTDARYEVTPLETYQRGDGRYCREYRTTAVIGGREQEVYGTACRQPDGSWEVVR